MNCYNNRGFKVETLYLQTRVIYCHLWYKSSSQYRLLLTSVGVGSKRMYVVTFESQCNNNLVIVCRATAISTHYISRRRVLQSQANFPSWFDHGMMKVFTFVNKGPMISKRSVIMNALCVRRLRGDTATVLLPEPPRLAPRMAFPRSIS